MALYYIKLYLATLVPFLAIDAFWIGIASRKLYSRYLGHLFAPKPNWIAAGLFYLLFVVGLLVFVVVPGLQEKSLVATMARAALFGLITYATYDLTNLATVKDWPVLITIIDLLWGMVVSIIVSLVSYTLGT